VVNVLVAQRDRFRAKALEAEGELAGARQALAAAKAEAAGVRADNAALVGRLRYVQGFAAARGEDAEAGRPGGGPGGSGASAAAAAAIAAKYERAYDDSVGPFQEFQGQQRERQRRALAAPDRAMYALATLVAGSRASRLFIFAYLAALHVLVFSTMARMASASSTALTAHTESVLLGSRNDATAAMHGGAGR
jgi:homeobox protein cut-like